MVQTVSSYDEGGNSRSILSKRFDTALALLFGVGAMGLSNTDGDSNWFRAVLLLLLLLALLTGELEEQSMVILLTFLRDSGVFLGDG